MAIDDFDPSEMETEELLPPESTPESAYIPDTNGDPEGSEERAKQIAIVLPDFFYRRYRLDDEGNPTFNTTVVDAIMEVFDAKYGGKSQLRNATKNRILGTWSPKPKDSYIK